MTDVLGFFDSVFLELPTMKSQTKFLVWVSISRAFTNTLAYLSVVKTLRVFLISETHKFPVLVGDWQLLCSFLVFPLLLGNDVKCEYLLFKCYFQLAVSLPDSFTLAATAQFTSCLELQAAFLADLIDPSAAPVLIRVFCLSLECPFEFG